MALLGAIVGLGELAAGEELIAMQALGVSPGALLGRCWKLGFW